jgi:two-component system nitrate/nitrite response regulator NarL
MNKQDNPGSLRLVYDDASLPVLRVVVVDDHALITIGLEAVLPGLTDGQMQVVGTTADAAEAADLVGSTDAHVAIVDLAMPPPGGLHAIREISQQHRRVAVLAVSGTSSMDQALAALAAGAIGFVPKTAGPETLVEPIRIAARGGCVVPRPLMDVLVRAAVGPVSRQARTLSEKEIELLKLVASGRSADQMAQELYVSTRTLKRSLSALYEKLNVSTRQEAAAFAGRAGLVDDAESSTDAEPGSEVKADSPRPQLADDDPSG